MLSRQLEFHAEADSEFFSQVPPLPGVFLLRGQAGAEPYAGKTANLKQRLIRLLGPPQENSKRLNLRTRCTSAGFSATGSDFESSFLLYRLLREIFPKSYRDRLRLRFPALIKLNLENQFPRAYVTRRMTKLSGQPVYYGPFASRASAEKFLNDSLDFFKMRRCIEDLNPDPAFPGCIYSEMKMCLAPCFKGCTDEEYAREVGRVNQYFDTGSQSLLEELAQQREAASGELKFELAASLHARMEKLRGVTTAAALPEIVRPIHKMKAVIVQPGAEKNSAALFLVEQGSISGAVSFCVQERTNLVEDGHAKSIPPRSLESRLADCLSSILPATPASAMEVNEHLAILKRWYYRSRRTGEIFFASAAGELPLRRIVRGIGRVLKGEILAEGQLNSSPPVAAPEAS